MEEGNDLRTTASTNMNDTSSRNKSKPGDNYP